VDAIASDRAFSSTLTGGGPAMFANERPVESPGPELQATSLDERVTYLLRVKHASDQRWGIHGRLVARGLLLPGCAVCRATADRADQELGFLLHERVNDPETVVRLIASHGFCRRHVGRLRHLADTTYGDQRKVVLIYAHLVEALQRRLERRTSLVAALAPTQPCPLCASAAAAERDALTWVLEALTVPALTAAFAEREPFCLEHVALARLAEPAEGARLSDRLRAAVIAIGQERAGRLAAESTGGDRLALLLGGGWPNDETPRGRRILECPVCRDAADAEREACLALANGEPFDGLPCATHLRLLRKTLEPAAWPGSLTARMTVRIESSLQLLDDHCRRRLANRFEVLHRRQPAFPAARLVPEGCPVCRVVGAAARSRVNRSPSPDLVEHGCLPHLRWRAQADRDFRRSLAAPLRQRLGGLSALVGQALGLGEAAGYAQRGRWAAVADALADLFTEREERCSGRLR
jgi:hypothetical protein